MLPQQITVNLRRQELFSSGQHVSELRRGNLHQIRQYHRRDARIVKTLRKIFPLHGKEFFRVLFTASKSTDAGMGNDFLRFVPILKREEHIRPHQKPQFILRTLFTQFTHRIGGIALSAPLDLHH